MSKKLHCLTGLEIPQSDLANLLKEAQYIKNNPKAYQHALSNQCLVMLFEKPSFRTRLSFSAAIQSMGGYVLESMADTRKQETPQDIAGVLNGYANFVMLRTHDDQTLKTLSQYAAIPIINGLSALHHPCQILADLLSIQETFGQLDGLTLSYIGDGNNILHSLMLLAPQMGVNIRYCCPKGHEPHTDIVQLAIKMNSDKITACETPQAAVQQADAVYTDVWVSMGFETQNNHAFDGFQVNEALLAQAKPQVVFMHCMPMLRGVEVSNTLPDSTQSIIFTQSENRLHVQKALLLYLAKLS